MSEGDLYALIGAIIMMIAFSGIITTIGLMLANHLDDYGDD